MNELTQPKILIIDDEPSNIALIKIVLKKENYTFVDASNGEEGIALAQKEAPNVILMDAIMPTMDGFEATKAIRLTKNLERTPILMITGLTDKEDRIKALDCGVNDFVTKPFDTNELIARCRSYVNMSQLNASYVLASIDHDTNLPNLVALQERLAPQNESYKMLMIWINHIEEIEEFYGAPIRLEVEKKFVGTLHKYMDVTLLDMVYCTSKGEYVLLLKDRNDFDMAVLSKTFIEAVKKDTIYIKQTDTQIDITVSISYIEGFEKLYEQSRLALKYAAYVGNEVVEAKTVAHSHLEQSKKNIVWAKKVKKALQENRIEPYFQALYNNKTKTIDKYESLVRLIEEDGKVVSPFFFLEIAQKAKLYLDLTRTVFDQACKTFRDREEGFSINLSGIDIEDDGLRNYLVDVLRSEPKIAKKIVFEMLEDENFRDFDVLKGFIKEVKSLGAKIAIDDFGSGYSNFIRLLDFEPDILKIDGSLIKNITKDPFSLHVVKTIKDFADKIGIVTVAEFVSDEEIQKTIQSLDIDYTQGYFIAEPKPASQLEKA